MTDTLRQRGQLSWAMAGEGSIHLYELVARDDRIEPKPAASEDNFSRYVSPTESREGTQGRTICEVYRMGPGARFESMQRSAL